MSKYNYLSLTSKQKLYLTIIFFLIEYIDVPVKKKFPLKEFRLKGEEIYKENILLNINRNLPGGYKIFLEEKYIDKNIFLQKNQVLRVLFRTKYQSWDLILYLFLIKSIKIRKSSFIFFIYSLLLPITFYNIFLYLDNLYFYI